MNNWLAFSLSPQELPACQPHQVHISGEDVSADCFGISTDTSPSPLPSFGILEAFNRTNSHHSQDWNMKSLAFKGNSSSELSMLVESSSNQNNIEEDEAPKLEDFLGGNSFADNGQRSYGGNTDNYMFPNCSLQLPAAVAAASSGSGNSNLMNNHGTNSKTNGNSIGLSMIKSWLRNQPVPPVESLNNEATAYGGNNNDVGGVVVGSNIGTSQSLSLSMSTGSQSSSSLPLLASTAGGGGGECSSSDNNRQNSSGGALDAQSGAIEAVPRKSIDTFGQRTSIYRGVTRHRWTGRYEAHLWDNSCRREGQTRKGRQVYLGGYDKEEKAARSYDLAALKYWGPTTTTNFPISNYEKELEEMKHMTRQEYVASLRRKSSGFSRGASIYRGVTRHHQHGRWQARIGRVAGNKDLYLGTFSTQEEAAEAYDIAAIKFRGPNAVTNFEMSRYDVKSILESSTLPIGGAAKRLKEAADHTSAATDININCHGSSNLIPASHLTDAGYLPHHYHHYFQQTQPLGFYNPYTTDQQQKGWCKQEQDAILAAHNLQDLHQLHLSNSNNVNTHNFFQHRLMDTSSTMEHSTGSNSIVYNNGYAVAPIPTTMLAADHQNTNQGNISYGGDSDHTMMVSSAYYLPSHQSSEVSIAKANAYDSWMPATATAQVAMAKTGDVGVSHGVPLFTVWNDA